MRLFATAVLSAIVMLSTLSPAIAQGCSASNPCKAGCCSKFGFCGLGPDYCAKDICVANCDRKAQCDPGGYGAVYVNHTTCPLNVCCSKWGFCGVTEEFCGSKKVPQPSCSKSKTFQRVVGYYEGWAVNRPCNVFYPEQIPLGVYTHLNFAFATIDPKTFEVLPASSNDLEMYRRLTDLKWRDPALKVFIAIGGWTFNDENQKTRTTFSDLAKSEANQQAFIKSLISFMSTYNFDGVDLDWEYPEAPDRGGTSEDYSNFPKFLANLKAALKGTAGRDGVSITLPASYWYLQHFDIKKLINHVDFFNIMSYDIHGVWDIPNKWTGPYLNAHTNLTEIKDALDLLWRNNISPEKVTMGLAFYGRGFTANSPNCLTPGCTYGSGSEARRCSHEVGVLLNSELVDIMAVKKLQPKLYKDAAIKLLTFDTNQWVAYDDAETLGLKVDFAKSKCLGGVMVWAVSHDTRNATYSIALANLARLSIPSIINIGLVDNDLDSFQTVGKHKQCLWANCGDPCPAGYSAQMRSDKGARDGEYMLNDSGCHNNQLKVLCCPTHDPIPLCGWYDHNNGDCKPNCPADSVEVGSTSSHCGKHGRQGKKQYQAACCSKVTSWTDAGMLSQENLRLASQCSWGNYPSCDWQCSSGSMLVSSLDGSGGATCWSGGIGSKHLRPLCCDQPDSNWKYTDCEWYRDIGAGSTESKDCRSGCPADKVQVSLSSEGCRTGSWSYCCSPIAQTLDKRSGPMAGQYEWALQLYIDDPTCPSEATKDLEPRGFESYNSFSDNSTFADYSLIARKSELAMSIIRTVEDLVNQLVSHDVVDDTLIRLWSRIVVPVYPYLTIPNIRDWMNGNVRVWPVMNTHNTALNLYVICRLGLYQWNRQIGDTLSNVKQLGCVATSVVICKVKKPTIEKRTRDPIAWSVTIAGQTYSLSSQSQPYRSSNDWSVLDPFQVEIYGQIYYFPGRGCTNYVLRIMNQVEERRAGNLPDIATEHGLELQTLPMWYVDAMQGILSGDPNTPNPAGAIDPQFFMDTLVRSGAVRTIPNPPGAASGGANLWTVEDRLFNALGSTLNDGVFVLAESQLNCLKAVIWACNTNLVAEDIMNSFARSRDVIDAENALTSVRNVVSIFRYLNDGAVHANLATIIMDIRRELRIAERIHSHLFPGRRVAAVDSFTNWMDSHFSRMHTNMVRWVKQWLKVIEDTWQNDGVNGPAIKLLTSSIQAEASSQKVNTQGFFQPV